MKNKLTPLQKGDIINSTNSKPIIIIETPKKHYWKWYWRIFHYITFKKYFIPSITYKISDLIQK